MTAIDLPEEAARQSLRVAAAALDAAELQARPYGMSTALAQLARAHAALLALPTAEGYLLQALRWSRAAQSTDLTVDLLCELCELAEGLAQRQDAQAAGAGHAARERARDCAFEASTLAGRVADPDWEVKVLLRISDVLDRCGDRDDAVQMQARAMRLLSCESAADLDASLLPGLGRLADT